MAKATVEQNATLVAQAAVFAVRAHEGQKRKGTQFAYSTHPLGVGHLLREYYPDDPALEAAGYLHDVLEDTNVPEIELRRRFGDDVTDLVLGVTNKGKWKLSDYLDNPRVLRLKAADILDNVTDTIRGLEKGHDVWSRFGAGRRKAKKWREHTEVIRKGLSGEPLVDEVDAAVTKVSQL
jgi:guanosine-3',5'-bis(diphosphate) 3'-pyrophosphohydrolase